MKELFGRPFRVRDLAEVFGAYLAIDKKLEDEWEAAIDLGETLAADRVKRRRRLNQQAYFLLCFGQIEAEIDSQCRSVIRARRAAPRWENRRPWYLYNPDDKRLSGLSFDERAALLLDRDAGPGSAWARLMQHYSTRNRIAHGSLLSTEIDISVVVNDLYLIHSEMAP